MNLSDDHKNEIKEQHKLLEHELLQSLFALYNENPKLMPPDFRKEFVRKDDSQERLTMDYISGMMDTFARLEYEKYSNKKFEEMII